MAKTKKVVIDTDFGTDVDDAIAVALAMASPDEIEVQAFTVMGRQSIYRKKMLEDFLSYLGDDCAVPPVYAGWDAPPPVPYGFSVTTPGQSFPGSGFGNYAKHLGGAYQFNWFGDEGTLDPNSPTQAASAQPYRPFDPPPPPPPTTPAGYSTFEAGQQLVDILSRQDVDFIGLGPLTNLYQALTSPTLKPAGDILIPQLTVMGVHLQPTLYGGHFLSAGIDYNLASDLVSALYVLNETAGGSPGPIGAAKWVTADVTLKTWLTTAQLNSLEASKHPFLQQLVKMIHKWTPIQTNLFKAEIGNAAFLHDPLTLACSFDDSWCNFQQFYLELELTNSLGLRWIERQQSIPNLTIELNCAVSVNPSPSGETFQDWLVQRLLNRFS
jgi:inosine-uridine nucleoside N-ribohydrolase